MIRTAGYWTPSRADEHRSGIVLFSALPPPDRGEVPAEVCARNEGVRRRLRAEGIHVDVKTGLLRASFHTVHTTLDLERLGDALRRIRR